MDNYRIVLYLSDMTAELPVMPEKLTVKRSLDSSEKTVLELGNVNILKGAKLRQVSFSSFFPAARIPSVSASQKSTHAAVMSFFFMRTPPDENYAP